jgi:hypothetical protein
MSMSIESLGVATDRSGASGDAGSTGEVVDAVQWALADYDGDNLWRDVIMRLPGYDEASTALLAPIAAGTVFVAAGIGYQWRPELGTWQTFDPAAEIGQAMNDPLIVGILRLRNLLRPWRRRVGHPGNARQVPGAAKVRRRAESMLMLLAGYDPAMLRRRMRRFRY